GGGKEGEPAPSCVQAPAPPGHARWGQRRRKASSSAEASAPPGRARWRRKRWRPGFLVHKPRSTGASPVGAIDAARHPLVQKPPLHRGEPGGGDRSLSSQCAPLKGSRAGGGGATTRPSSYSSTRS